MLSKEQLQTIADALGNHPEAPEDLKRIIQAELDYQAATAPLWADRELILSKPNLTQEDEARLAELAEALSAASDRRPAEFGGMFHAIDLIGQNIIRRASQLDRYSDRVDGGCNSTATVITPDGSMCGSGTVRVAWASGGTGG